MKTVDQRDVSATALPPSTTTRVLTRHRTRGAKRTAASTLGAVLMVTGGFASAALAEPSLKLLDLQVFAKQSIKADHSDYEGWTAAGDIIALNDFKIAGDLTSGRQLAFERGRVGGVVTSPETQVSQVLSAGNGTVDDDALKRVSTDLDSLAAKLSTLAPTEQALVETEFHDGQPTAIIKVSARHDLDVVDMSAEQLISAGPGRLKVVLDGKATSRVLLRVHGPSVRLHDVGFSISGGLDPSNIAFLFPEASALEISASGGALDPAGRSLGVPGSVVAPNAIFNFASSKVTGHVYVKSIAPIAGLPGGQVDRFSSACSSPSDDGCLKSQILAAATPTENQDHDPVVLRRKD